MKLTTRLEHWPIRGVFRIARGEAQQSICLVAEIACAGRVGRGEGCPEPDIGFDPQVEMARAAVAAEALLAGLDRAGLAALLPPGPARNAIDCALWDLEAKLTGRSVAELAGLPPSGPVTTLYTLSLDTPEAMGRAAAQAAGMSPILKLKLNGGEDLARVAAVRAAAPAARLVVDANESWSADDLEIRLAQMAALGVEVVEQPLPRGADDALGAMRRPLAVCADESCKDRSDLPRLAGRYDMINIKLDKTGGLTEALAMASEAQDLGLRLMVGCMVGTSLAMAPAHLLAQRAAIVDIDGPLLLADDREPRLSYVSGRVDPPGRDLWG